MKRRFLYALAVCRRYAQTEVGEKRLVAALTTMSVVFVLDVVLLFIGCVL